MVRGDRTDKVQSEKDIQQRFLPVAASMVCTHFSLSKIWFFGTNFCGNRRTDMPVGYGSVVVRMARGHLQGVIVHLATTGGGRVFGLAKGVERMLDHVSDSMSNAERESWVLDHELVHFIGLSRYNSKSSQRSGNPRNPAVFEHLFSSMGLYSAPTKRGIMADLPAKRVYHPDTSDKIGE